MFRLKKILCFAVAPLLAALLATPLSAGMIQNAGFEDNNGVDQFTSWNNVVDTTSTLDSAIRVDDGSDADDLSGLGPKPGFGNSQALLKNSDQDFLYPNRGFGLNVATDEAIEAALLLPDDILDDIADDLGAAAPFAVRGSAIWQDFMGMEGQEITFCWNFLTHETFTTGGPNPDFAFVSLVQITDPDPLPAIDGEYLEVLASANQVLNDPDTGNYVRASGFNMRTLTVPSNGTFRLGFGVIAAKDAGFASALLLDGPGNMVPEPSTVLLMATAVLCLIPFAVNLRKRREANRLC